MEFRRVVKKDTTDRRLVRSLLNEPRVSATCPMVLKRVVYGNIAKTLHTRLTIGFHGHDESECRTQTSRFAPVREKVQEAGGEWTSLKPGTCPSPKGPL